MTWIEAKETLAKVQLCRMIPISDPHCTSCKNCKLNVSDEHVQEAFDYIYKLMKERDFNV